jgi:UDP-glucose 4-epimerase
LEDKTLRVFGDGEQSRDFTYIDNVVHANLLALEAKEAPGKVFNVGCGERISLNQLIRFLEAITGKKAKVEYTQPRRGDVRHSLAAIALAEQVLAYKPQVTTEEGLRRTVETFSVARRPALKAVP